MAPSTKVRPIDSFTLIYKVLALAGYYKHLVKPKSYWKYVCHQMYRPVGFLIPLILNLMHLIYIYQTLGEIETVLEVIMLEIPHSQLLVKYLVWNVYSTKLDRIHDSFAKDHMFLPANEKEEEFLIKDKKRITIITKRVFVFVGVTATLWTLSHFSKKLQDPQTQIHAYIPFETDTWPRYSVMVIIFTCLSNLWNVYGHISFDCAIVAYYSQAHTQLKMIRYHLERLTQADDSLEPAGVTKGSGFQYRDMVDPKIKERFVHIVKKYEKVVWYTQEVGGVLNKPIGYGLLSTCVTVCLCVSSVSSGNLSFAVVFFLITYSIVLLSQVFGYCYSCALVTEESTLLNTSIYMSDWYTLSPGFRRGILIAMVRWSRPLVPSVNSFVVVPLTLDTFIMFIKSTYTLYTMLEVTKSK